MTRSIIKPKNILFILKEHNANKYTTMKQVYNTKYAYHFVRDTNNEMQQLMKLLGCDQCICWYRLKDKNVVRDIF